MLNLSIRANFITYQFGNTHRHNLVDDGVKTGLSDLLFENE